MDMLDSDQINALRERVEAERTVFLSHTAKDKPKARQLAEDLRINGIRVWLDEREVRPGDSVIEKIESGIKASRYVFFLASRDSIAAPWVLEEVRMAMHDGITRKRVRVVAVRLDQTPLPGFLSEKKHVDISSDYNAGLTELLTLFE